MLSTTLRDVVLTSAGHDWDLSSGTFKFTSGMDGVAQAIDFAIRMHKGEWFMNTSEGIPYFVREGVSPSEALLGQKDVNLQRRVIAAYTPVINAVEGVIAINDVAAVLSGRVMTVTWNVTIGFDDLVTQTRNGTTVITR